MRRRSGTQWTFVRVSPSSPPGEELAGEPGEPTPPEDASTLAGLWLREGSGQLLSLGADGTYAVDDAGELGVDAADTGTFELDRNGSLTLTSGPKSRACSQGDRWVWEGAEIEVGPTVEDPTGVAQGGDWTLVGDVTEDACGHGAAEDVRWLRISY